jgi:CRP-like cAMP-binding protein
MALLSDQTRNATVRATVPTLLYSLSRADFLELLKQEASIRDAVSAAVAARRAAFAAIGAAQAA